MHFYYDELETEIGPLTIVANERAVLRIDYGIFAELDALLEAWLRKHFSITDVLLQSANLHDVKSELSSYLKGERTEFTFQIDLAGTAFQMSVWRALLDRVAYGKTVSYKQIAEAIGNPKAVRAVGGAVNKNPIAIVVPCHRVIGANGKLVGYNGGLAKKELLLQLENAHPFATKMIGKRQASSP